MGLVTRGGIAGIIVGWASRLRFPYLVLLTAVLFVLNLFIPDVLPLADELIMGLVTVLLASFRKKPDNNPETLPDDDQPH